MNLLLFKKAVRNAYSIGLALTYLVIFSLFAYLIVVFATDFVHATIESYELGYTAETFGLGLAATIAIWFMAELVVMLVEMVEHISIILVTIFVSDKNLRRGYRLFLKDHNMRAENVHIWQWTILAFGGDEPPKDAGRERYYRDRTWPWYLKSVSPLTPAFNLAKKLAPSNWRA